MNSKLDKLAEIEGYPNATAMLEASVMDSVVPCICMNEGCDASSNLEPDCRKGYCEECQEQSMQSCLIIAGLI